MKSKSHNDYQRVDCNILFIIPVVTSGEVASVHILFQRCPLFYTQSFYFVRGLIHAIQVNLNPFKRQLIIHGKAHP